MQGGSGGNDGGVGCTGAGAGGTGGAGGLGMSGADLTDEQRQRLIALLQGLEYARLGHARPSAGAIALSYVNAVLFGIIICFLLFG